MKKQLRMVLQAGLYVGLFGSSVASAQQAPQVAGTEAHGGDTCEARIIEIRDAIDAWIVRGIGPTRLKLPADVSVDDYSTAMREATGDRSVKISCVKGPVYLNPEAKTEPKTCVSRSGGGVTRRIVCDRDAFMNGTSPEDQYVLVHHEYATTAILGSGGRLEKTSDYTISTQLKSFLKDRVVKVLDDTPSTQRPQPVEGPHGTKWVNPIEQCEFDKRMGRDMPGLVNGNCREFYYGEKLEPRKLTRNFEIMTTEVTQLQWFRVMGENPSRFDKLENCPEEHSPTVKKIEGFRGCPNHPVEEVSWNDAQRFISKLQRGNTQTLYFLPREVEWEYATRAGTKTAYSFGDEEEYLAAHGWHLGTQTQAVGRLRSNPWLLYDVHGNVSEWTYDFWSSVNLDRVIRGGSWYYSASISRSASRPSLAPSGLAPSVGFRLARTRIR